MNIIKRNFKIRKIKIKKKINYFFKLNKNLFNLKKYINSYKYLRVLRFFLKKNLMLLYKNKILSILKIKIFNKKFINKKNNFSCIKNYFYKNNNYFYFNKFFIYNILILKNFKNNLSKKLLNIKNIFKILIIKKKINIKKNYFFKFQINKLKKVLKKKFFFLKKKNFFFKTFFKNIDYSLYRICLYKKLFFIYLSKKNEKLDFLNKSFLKKNFYLKNLILNKKFNLKIKYNFYFFLKNLKKNKNYNKLKINIKLLKIENYIKALKKKYNKKYYFSFKKKIKYFKILKKFFSFFLLKKLEKNLNFIKNFFNILKYVYKKY